MITLMSQMVGCLLIAAGIGVAVGWFVRGLPKHSVKQPYEDLVTQARAKEHVLETTSHDLKVKTSAMQILEQKIMSAETLYSSAQRELIARGERQKALEAELVLRSKRLTDLETEGATARRRVSEVESIMAAQTDELRGMQQTCRTAEHAREVTEQEIRVLREHITQLNEGLAERDRLRVQVEKLESSQSRVHQLEVELSDREATHREGIHQLERAITERDHRISEFDSIAATQTEELRGAQQACRTAEHAREVMEQEIRVLREHIAQLNDGLAERDRLRVQVEKLETAQSRVHQLEVELSDREATHREGIHQLERAITERDHRISGFDSIAAAQADELRETQQACRTGEHAREVMEQEIRVLREHITQLNDGLAERDRLRIQVEKLESAQSRVHQLEVEQSDREATHREGIRQLERAITERDHRIEELVSVTQLLREKEADLLEWGKKYARTVQEHEEEVTTLQARCAAQDQLHAQHLLDEQRLHERDEQIGNLQRQLQDLQTERQTLSNEVQRIPEKDEHIDRLRKQLREMRATLRTKVDSATAVPRQARENGTQLKSRIGPPKVDKEMQKDDLKKIHGIGTALAQTLNKMGTSTFIQIARWKPDDIKKIAKKLETDPERIKRDNWIADAKEQHYRKYGERL